MPSNFESCLFKTNYIYGICEKHHLYVKNKTGNMRY